MVFTNILTKHQNNFIHTKCVVLLRRGGIYIRRRRKILLNSRASVMVMPIQCAECLFTSAYTLCK